MPDLGLTFQNLYEEVEKYLGTYNSGSASTTDANDAKFIVNRAYARFCSYYDWTFLSQERTLQTESGKYKYELPSDFSYLITPKLMFEDDDGFPPVIQTSPIQLQQMRSETAYSGYPIYFALQAGSYYRETGQGWEIQLYPTPDSTFNIHYLCHISPQKLENTGDIPIGGPDIVDCLLELSLAYAEAYKDEERAVHNEVVQEILGPAKSMDNRRRPAHLGSMLAAVSLMVDESQVHHGEVIIST